MRALVLVAALAASPLSAHEFWLEPLEYTIAPDGKLQAELVNGQLFEGNRYGYIPRRFDRFDLADGADTAPVENRIGARPALDMESPGEGLFVIAYQSTPSVVRYDGFDDFLSFAEHKAFEAVRSRHEAAGFPMEDFGELYTRYSKTLIAAGDGAGADRRMGLETEIVALDNPYVDDLADGLRVRVYYKDAPRAGAQVELFRKAPDGSVQVETHFTDDMGVATLPVRPGFAYMADAVVLRKPAVAIAEERDVVWETLWANLTFAVPLDGVQGD